MSQGDCPKHGRWYGICHSCHKENEERESRESWRRLYDQNEELRAKLEKAEKVIEAANNMSQRLQSLPWHRQNSEKDALTCLNNTVWKEWNYGECHELFEALREYRVEETK